METDSLVVWFFKIASSDCLTKEETSALREHVELAVKNRRHCSRLALLQAHLDTVPAGLTELSSIEATHDVHFCARTRSTLSNGIHRSWLTFVDHLSQRMQEACIPYVRESEDKRLIAELLWEGTAAKTNGWTHTQHGEQAAGIEHTTADRIYQLVMRPAIQAKIETLVSLQRHIDVANAAFHSFEDRCSKLELVHLHGKASLACNHIDSLRRWHKKVHADPAKLVALDSIFEQPFVIKLLATAARWPAGGCLKDPRAARAFASAVATSPKCMQEHDYVVLAQWMQRYALPVRQACSREKARIDTLMVNGPPRRWSHTRSWHDVDVMYGVEVHELPPRNRVVLQPPGHLGAFDNLPSSVRISLGRINLNVQQAMPVVALGAVVCFLLVEGKLPLSHVGNDYLKRVVGCEYISYEARLRDVLLTELDPVAVRVMHCEPPVCAPLPDSWTALRNRLWTGKASQEDKSSALADESGTRSVA
tara:strand:- start:34723 stop:36156 length:1434 start_codon:yes stop_codon:yes gene_type:complete